MAKKLHDLLVKLISTYENEYKKVWATNNFQNPLGDFVRNDITNCIEQNINSEKYMVKGSVGSGRWAKVPWIAVLDPRITNTPQKGVYIVYLLNKSKKELYLTLNQGAKEIPSTPKGKIKILSERAQNIHNALGEFSGFKYDVIYSGSPKYDAGCIYYKKYTINSLPDDKALFDDLQNLAEIYEKYYENVFSTTGESDDLEDNDDLSTEITLERIQAYIKSTGYEYDKKLISNFYLCLKSKPFVLLAGMSGTGKTRLVRLFAEAIGAYGSGRYEQIAVKPDWSDSTDLFGHVNLKDKFVPGAIIEFIKKAADDSDNLPYILCLDEMNLARVEYYFSDFLSIIETRDWDSDEIVTDDLVPKICYSGDSSAETLYEHLMLPENLYIVGTVNMDETTFPFSKKVLDRTNTIEFSDVNFDLPDVMSMNAAEPMEVSNDFLRASYLNLRTDCIDRWESVKKLNEKIVEINAVLEKGDANFGYRIRDEIIFYMLYNEEYELLSEKEAFDNQ